MAKKPSKKINVKAKKQLVSTYAPRPGGPVFTRVIEKGSGDFIVEKVKDPSGVEKVRAITKEDLLRSKTDLT